MRKALLFLPLIVLHLIIFRAGSAWAQNTPPQLIRPIGVVTKIQAGNFTLHTDAGPDLLIVLADNVTFLRVPPGSTNLNSATKIGLSDISLGDRILVRGRVSEDQKSVIAASVIVMTKSDLAGARQAESSDWQRRGVGGTVQSVNSATKEITIVAPTTPPASGSSAHAVTVVLATNAVLLRYAPDSVKFSDAKPSAFEQIKVGDQIRALGTKSEDGGRFTAEKLVSGTFRNVGVTVASVDAQSRAISAKESPSGQPLLVRTNADSRLHRLPPTLAQNLARSTSAGAQAGKSEAGENMQQMLESAPAFDLAELKPGDSLIVVSTEGTTPSEVTAIEIFAGVEAILAARPKDSNKSVLGSWSLGMSGGEGGP
jgi:hypothetical protein